jgi:hypothetical protein
LYEFYGDWQKQKSREKDVSHLLTEIDKINIKFIKNVEENGRIRNLAGVNQQQGKIIQYFMYSYLDNDDKNEVIVPYIFSPRLDILMYNVYNSKILDKEDIKGLGKYELGILRNVIFAKYNYAFSSEFYQAYFNLYEFYGDWQKRKTRAKDVSQLLTEADKENIKFLKETAEKL